MLPSEGAAVVGQNTNGKVVAFEGTAKAPYFRLLEVTKIADEDEEDGPRAEVITSHRIPDNWCLITPVVYKQDVALPAVPQFEKLGEVFSGGMLSDYLKKVTNLEVLEYGQLDVELPWPLAQLRVVEKAPGKGRSEQGDEDDVEDDDEDDDGDGQLPFNIGRFKFLDEHRKRDLPCGASWFTQVALGDVTWQLGHATYNFAVSSSDSLLCKYVGSFCDRTSALHGLLNAEKMVIFFVREPEFDPALVTLKDKAMR